MVFVRGAFALSLFAALHDVDVATEAEAASAVCFGL
jgi:hypothetical protein